MLTIINELFLNALS